MKKILNLIIAGGIAAVFIPSNRGLSQTASTDSYAEGVSLLKAKQYTAALPLLEAAVEKNPNAASYYNLGYCQVSLGKLKEADLNFYRSDKLHSNPDLARYADNLFDHLPADGRQWVLEGWLDPPDFSAAVSAVSEPQADYKWKCKSLAGQKLDFAQLKGKTVFLNFWATWCGPCVAEMPGLDRLCQKMKDEPIAFLFVSREDHKTVKKFIDEKKFSMPVYLLNGEPPDAFSLNQGIPSTFVISAKGQVVFKSVGSVKWDDPKCVEFLKKVVKQEAL